MIYSVPEGRQVATLPGDSSQPELPDGFPTGSVAYAPDGHLFIGAGLGDLRIVDPSTVKVIRSFPEEELASRSLSFSADGSVLLAVRSFDGHVSRIDPSTGSVIWGTESGRGCGLPVLVARRSRFYCGGLGIREYDLDSGRPTGVDLTENASGSSDLAVMDDESELVAFGGFSPTVVHWRIDGGGPIDHRLIGVQPGVDGFLPDGNLVVGGSADPDVVDAESGAIIDGLDGLQDADASSTTSEVFGGRDVADGALGK